MAAGAALSMTLWSTIDTAPRDGTAIWLLVDGHPYIGFCEPSDWLHKHDRWFVKSTFVRRGDPQDYRSTPTTDNVYSCHGVDVKPTHWQPLPEPFTNGETAPRTEADWRKGRTDSGSEM